MSEISYHQQQYIRHQKREKKLVLFLRIFILLFFLVLWEISARTGLIDSFIFSSPVMIWHSFCSMCRDGSIFSPSLCYNYGNTGQFSVRCCSGCRDGGSAVDLSQTCEDHRALSRSTEQPSEICSGTFAYCMAWCQRTDDYCLRYVGCYLWFDFESVYRFWRS